MFVWFSVIRLKALHNVLVSLHCRELHATIRKEVSCQSTGLLRV